MNGVKKGDRFSAFSFLINVSCHLSTKRVVSSGCISSIGLGGGVVAMVHPIHAPMPRTTINAMSTGMAISHSRMASKAGQKSATV